LLPSQRSGTSVNAQVEVQVRALGDHDQLVSAALGAQLAAPTRMDEPVKR
jgi:hypothetical protein